MTPARLRRATAELDLLRSRLELCFWALRRMLGLITALALTVAFVVSLLRGAPVPTERSLATGIAAAACSQASKILRKTPGCPVSEDPHLRGQPSDRPAIDSADGALGMASSACGRAPGRRR